MTERVVTLIDMDCFYCQVEVREKPELQGQPCAVVQYNAWRGGGIIAVNYEARAKGVTRNMRGNDAKEKCPEIVLVQVPEVRGKADLTKYRNAGKEVIQVLLEFGGIVERASVDEAYVDITNLVNERLNLDYTADDFMTSLGNTFVVGHDDGERDVGLRQWIQFVLNNQHEPTSQDDLRLAIGAMIVEEMRAKVFEKTSFRCSGGISHSKTIAKFACGIHKPNKQTILPQEKIADLFKTIKVTKLRGLGGKLGDSVVEELGCKMLSDMAALTMKQLRSKFDEKTSSWLYNIARGICTEPVKERDLPKSIGCSKNFRGPEMLDTREKVEFWVRSLSTEVSERLCRDRDDNNRQAKGLHVSLSAEKKGTVARAGPLHSYEVDKMVRQVMQLLSKVNEAPVTDKISWKPKVVNLSVAASKFEELTTNHSIANFFSKKSAATKECADLSDEIKSDIEPVESSIFRAEASITQSMVSTTSATTSAMEISPKSTKSDRLDDKSKDTKNNQPNVVNFFRQKQTISALHLPIAEPEKSKDSKVPTFESNLSAKDDQRKAPQSNYSEQDASVEDFGGISPEELVPTVEDFDPSILEFLPAALKRRVQDRVSLLRTRQRNEPVASSSTSNIDVETCEKCGIKISPFELPEHLDFHLAQELQKELRKSDPFPVRNVGDKTANAARPVPPVASKRKLSTNDASSKKQKNITSFFQTKD